MQSGQTLIIILMVMVLSLGTGLAVSSRTSSTIHQTANLANSEQALATAESAMELLLKQPLDAASNVLDVAIAAGFNKQADLTSTCTALPCYQDMGGGAKASVNITTTPLVNPTTSPFEFYIERDDVQQVWMTSGYTGQVNICWQKAGEVGTDGLPAALEVKVIAGNSPNSTLETYAFDANMTRRATNGFDTPSGSGSGLYFNCLHSFGLTNARALRIRTLYAGTSVSVAPAAGQPSIPFQGNIITTTGFVADIKRMVEVTKTLPQLPGIFDYGVYSGGEVIK